jgi:hypothetical protein
VRFHSVAAPDSSRNQDLGMVEHRLFLTAEAPRLRETRPRRSAPFPEITVLLGDPLLPDPVKREGRFTAEDAETVARLKAALAELPGYRFRYLDNHATLCAELRRARPDFVLNFCDEGFNNDAFLEMHVPALLARPQAHIVNISSMGGFLPFPGQTVYGASKAAVKLLTEGLHAELTGTKVRVTVVFPGAVATNIMANSGVALSVGEPGAHRTLTADQAARQILDGVERDRYRVLVGSDAKLLDRLYRLAPQRATAFIAKQMRDLLARPAKL